MSFCSFSVLKTFVYDPLVEWKDRRHRDTAAAAKEEVELFFKILKSH